MKRGVLILFCTIIILGIATLETVHINCSFKELINEFAALQPMIEKDVSSSESLKKIGELKELWENKKRVFSTYIPHNSIVEISMKVTRLIATVECADQTMAEIELNDLLQTLPEYNSRYNPTLHNLL